MLRHWLSKICWWKYCMVSIHWNHLLPTQWNFSSLAFAPKTFHVLNPISIILHHMFNFSYYYIYHTKYQSIYVIFIMNVFQLFFCHLWFHLNITKDTIFDCTFRNSNEKEYNYCLYIRSSTLVYKQWLSYNIIKDFRFFIIKLQCIIIRGKRFYYLKGNKQSSLLVYLTIQLSLFFAQSYLFLSCCRF